jgi:hypothetical protein
MPGAANSARRRAHVEGSSAPSGLSLAAQDRRLWQIKCRHSPRDTLQIRERFSVSDLVRVCYWMVEVMRLYSNLLLGPETLRRQGDPVA